MTGHGRTLSGRSVVSFLARAFLPPVILGIGLVVLAHFSGGSDPTERATLSLRIAGGLLLSSVVIVLIVILNRGAASGSTPVLGPQRRRHIWRGLAVGGVLWLVPAALAFAVLGLLGAPLAIEEPPGETVSVVLLVLVAVMLSEAVPEEVVFRGQLMHVLGERLQGWWVIFVQAGVFTAFALGLRGWTGLADLSLFLGMGIGLGYVRVLSGSVWIAVGFHAAFQTGSQLLLTHEVVTFPGSESAAMVSLGAVPFAFAAVVVAVLAPKFNQLLGSRKTGTEGRLGSELN